MSRQAIVFTLIGILLAAATAWWFFENFEHRVEEKEVGFHGEASRNDFLAAERFLEKYGMQIESLPTILDLKHMPQSNDVLFIPTGRYDLATEKIAELLDWVRQGGHLIVRARHPSRKGIKMDDELFQRLGVETHAKKDNLFDSEDRTVIKVQVNDTIEDKQVEFDKNIWMQDIGDSDLSWQVDGENGSHLLEFKLGEGYVTLLSDIEFLDNASIAKYDHASFLYTMVHIDNSKRHLWIIRNDDMPSLLSMLRHKAPATLILFGILILFWLWYTTRRFGPLQPASTASRRSLREHITSSGFYQWRNQNRTELFVSARTALQEQLAQTRPLWAKLDNMKLAGKLGKIAGIPSDQVLSVLKAKQADKEAEFTQFIEILSVIRKKL